MDSPYDPPLAEPRVEKLKPWVKWVSWGCGALVVLSLLILGSCFFMVKGAMTSGDKEYGPVCREYIGKLESGKFDDAYNLTGVEFKSVMDIDKHKNLMRAVVKNLGKIEKMEPQFVHAGYDTKGRSGLIIYNAKWERGTGTIKFSLRKTDWGYEIIGVFFESPVLTNIINESITQSNGTP